MGERLPSNRHHIRDGILSCVEMLFIMVLLHTRSYRAFKHCWCYRGVRNSAPDLAHCPVMNGL